ncbi:MAG TPA: GNAT family N-acetyltransferase [Solirubrobacteraceae bacterium]
MSAVEIGDATREEMVAGAALLAASLGFSAADAIPAWAMQAAAESGGVVLAARDGGGLVGWSYATAAWEDGEAHLYSCGLAVVAGHRSRGVGRALKLAQRERALALGYRSIRWTADPLAAPALRLYLSGLGARMTRYRAGLFDGLRAADGVPLDDVEIEWRLDGDGDVDGREPARDRVEIPADRAALSPSEQLRWQIRVREAFARRLGEGAVGVGVDRDPGTGRCWVTFA